MTALARATYQIDLNEIRSSGYRIPAQLKQAAKTNSDQYLDTQDFKGIDKTCKETKWSCAEQAVVEWRTRIILETLQKRSDELLSVRPDLDLQELAHVASVYSIGVSNPVALTNELTDKIAEYPRMHEMSPKGVLAFVVVWVSLRTTMFLIEDLPKDKKKIFSMQDFALALQAIENDELHLGGLPEKLQRYVYVSYDARNDTFLLRNSFFHNPDFAYEKGQPWIVAMIVAHESYHYLQDHQPGYYTNYVESEVALEKLMYQVAMLYAGEDYKNKSREEFKKELDYTDEPEDSPRRWFYAFVPPTDHYDQLIDQMAVAQWNGEEFEPSLQQDAEHVYAQNKLVGNYLQILDALEKKSDFLLSRVLRPKYGLEEVEFPQVPDRTLTNKEIIDLQAEMVERVYHAKVVLKDPDLAEKLMKDELIPSLTLLADKLVEVPMREIFEMVGSAQPGQTAHADQK